jgi:tyrosyl-tRNA synthetase
MGSSRVASDPPVKTDFLDDLQSRDLVHQCNSPALAERLRAGPLTAYNGIDPTADSLHVGSLVPVLTMVRLQRAGHRPIAVVGGGTGLIGDPSGKESERTLLSPDQVARNIAGIRSQLERFLDFGAGGAILVDNAEWLGKLNLIEFLRDIGKHFSVNVMMTRDSVRTRLETREQGISYTEFSYCLLQSYDFLELYDRYGCILQTGGSDQWGNMVSGADLIRRMRGVEAFALTFPLVTRADGTKFGKSEEGNIWLDAARTSPYHFYQFWLNTDDKDVIRYLLTFTFLPVDPIRNDIRAMLEAAPERREAQRTLAEQVTRMVHGDAALLRAQHTTGVLFSKDADFRQLSAEELEEAFRGAPTTSIPAACLGSPEASLLTILVEIGLYPSKGRARQDVPSGAVRVNNAPVQDIGYTLSMRDLLAGDFIVLRRGRKDYHVLRAVRS